MKVCILGPVVSSKYFGGVAVFTESMADGFKLIGHEVQIITDYTEKNETINHSPIEAVFKSPLRRNIRLPFLLNKKVIKLKPDILLTSLEYGWGNSYLKKKLPNTKIVHYLHAFPAKTTGSKLKNIVLNESMKFIAKGTDYMLSNSKLSSVVNKEIYGIRSDYIVSIGVGYDLLKTFEDANIVKEPNTVLYAGRFAKEKNILNLIEALRKIKNEQLKIFFAGDGPERKNVEAYAKKHNVNAFFLGQLDHKKLREYLSRSEVFVSLNPHEPFGIAYLEAFLYDCKVVCPLTGGQNDFINEFSESVFLTNPYMPGEIARTIDLALKNKKEKHYQDLILEKFTYSVVAKKILEIVNDNNI